MGESNERARCAIVWDSVAEKVWKDTGGSQEEILSNREAWGVRDRSKIKDRKKGITSAKK